MINNILCDVALKTDLTVNDYFNNCNLLVNIFNSEYNVIFTENNNTYCIHFSNINSECLHIDYNTGKIEFIENKSDINSEYSFW